MSVADPAARMRAAIVEGARDVFAEKGFAKATMGDLAKACGASPANLYNYFPSKKAIGFAVVGLYLDELNARLAALAAAPPAHAAEHLRAYIRIRIHHTVAHLRARPLLVELAEMAMEETAEATAFVEEVVAEELAALAAIIARGAAEGAFAVDDPEAAAWTAHLCVRYFATPRAISRFGLDTAEEDLEKVLDLVCAGLAAGAS